MPSSNEILGMNPVSLVNSEISASKCIICRFPYGTSPYPSCILLFILSEIRKRPIYLVRDAVNFEKDQEKENEDI